jgi:hypothetical protein
MHDLAEEIAPPPARPRARFEPPALVCHDLDQLATQEQRERAFEVEEKFDCTSLRRIVECVIKDEEVDKLFDAWFKTLSIGEPPKPNKEVKDLHSIFTMINNKMVEKRLYSWISRNVTRSGELEGLPFSLEMFQGQVCAPVTVQVMKDPPVQFVHVPLILIARHLIMDDRLLVERSQIFKDGVRVISNFVSGTKMEIICENTARHSIRPVVFSLFVDGTRVRRLLQFVWKV